MRKFEIINNKWIKYTYQNTNKYNINNTTITTSIEIKSISLIQVEIASKEHEKSFNVRYYITLIGNTEENNISLEYKSEEENQFNSDLKFLENLIYNK